MLSCLEWLAVEDKSERNPANKLLTESGKKSVVKRSRPTESPRKMSHLALDRWTAKTTFDQIEDPLGCNAASKVGNNCGNNWAQIPSKTMHYDTRTG